MKEIENLYNQFKNEIIEIQEKEVRVNIYCDEVQEKVCPYTEEKWIYIGIIVENLENPLLDEIIKERYMNNFDERSPYFAKNNRIIHWVGIKDADSKNIAKRWIDYILDPSKSGDKFYFYALGINVSKLNIENFDTEDIFNSIYNHFFRSALLYALKTFFPNKQIIVENIYHEIGQQEDHEYFPWHCIYKIETQEPNITFKCSEITFLPKSHRESEHGDKRSNLIQLCDLVLGMCVSLLHGINESKKSQYKKELLDLFLPLFREMIYEPENINSSYKYSGRVMIRFFPREKTKPNDVKRLMNQFYTKREIYYEE
jgi:hypothetical protein